MKQRAIGLLVLSVFLIVLVSGIVSANQQINTGLNITSYEINEYMIFVED